MNRLHLLNSGGLLAPNLAAECAPLMDAALDRLAAQLEIDGVDVTLFVSPRTLPETGVVGYAPDANRVELAVTPENPNFVRSWQGELTATLAHELHHVRRWRGPGYGETLLEALVSEGLAQQFEVAERGGPPPYARVTCDLDALWTRAQANLDGPYDHAAWFFGSDAQGLPRWGGYALGFELVGRFLSFSGGDALSHAETPAVIFRRAWSG